MKVFRLANFRKLILIIISVLLLEYALRYFGLGTPLLYIHDPQYEYIYAPNQKITRFRNSIFINELSMRSKPLSSKDKLRILKFGDSIINGGTLTDQDSLASTLLEKILSKKYKSNVRVLNISAGSWGPDNAFAYIKKNGSFDASLIVLVFSSHDLYDNMTFENIVGKDASYPKQEPFCAISELFNRYIFPKIFQSNSNKENEKIDNTTIENNESQINTGWLSFFEYSKKHNIPLLVYLHPTKKEFLLGDYNKKGIRLINLLESNNINYVLGINNISTDSYRDKIHINSRGQKKLFNTLLPSLSAHIDTLQIEKQ